MELYVLKYLAAFAETGTLSKAAEEIHASQPAVSRAMQKLEEELDVPLFNRSKNRISLNRFGALAARYAARILADCEKMEREVKAAWRDSAVFSYGSIAAFPIYELDAVVGELYAGAEINPVLAETDGPLVEGLDAGKFKLIVLCAPLEGGRYHNQRFFREKLSVLLPKHHRLARRKSIWLRDLAGEKILIHRHIGFWYPLCKGKIPGARFLEQAELSSLREIVRASELPSFMTNVSYKDASVPRNKVALPLKDPETDVTFWCVTLKERKKELAALFSRLADVSERYT